MKTILLFLLLIISMLSIRAEGRLFVNQCGYLIDMPKCVISNNGAVSYKIFSAESSSEVYSGNFISWISNDDATGYDLLIGDFSGFKTPGSYFIVSNLGDTSYHFNISNEVFDQLYRKSLKSFYYQRCGLQLVQAYAGIYQHAACHLIDAFHHSTSNASGFKITSGGWHDAGDFGKYIVNAGITVGTLLAAYENFPENFDADDLNIPESENGVPDILDEIRFELLWFLKMQDESGGVFTKLTPEVFSGMIMPNTDNSKRYIFEIASTATADFAAVTAKAARIFKMFDEEFAEECLQASIKAWEFLEANPDIVPPGGFRNPTGVITGEYGDSSDKDERLWAAIELYISTKQDKYIEYYTSKLTAAGLFDTPGWNNLKSLAHLAFLHNVNSENQFVNELLLNSLRSLCDGFCEVIEKNGFKVALNGSEYHWGSNSTVLNKAILLISAYEFFNDNKYLNAALDQMNYTLGVNAHDLSFVTGVGTKYPVNIHHRQSAADNIDEPVPGFIAGGPNRYLNDPKLKSLFNSSTPPALCYADHVDSYASNEIAINWNAPLVYVSGYFNSLQNISVNTDKQGFLPGTLKLYQNYPNPFNGSTEIIFHVNKTQSVDLRIIDILGREIFKKNLGIKPRGEYSFLWDGKDNDFVSMSSGIYVFNISGEQENLFKKLVLVK